MIRHALRYAAIGWAVFPLHTFIRGRCSCGKADCNAPAKHPIAALVPRGRNDATTDPEKIKSWWKRHPEANIGIATGRESGILVVDIDDNGAIPLGALPDTIEQITGGGGRHVVYRRPEGGRYISNTTTAGIVGVDSRADGGYIVAAPSLHRSGRRYEWEASGDPFDGGEIADAPEWWLDAIRAEDAPLFSAQAAPAWNPTGELPDNLEAMLRTIPAHDYATWRDVGLALHHAAPVDGLDWWDWWSATASNYDAASIRREWANFTRRAHLVARPVTIDTVRRLADENGYADERLGIGEEIAGMLIDSEQEKQAEIVREAAQAMPHESIAMPEIMPARGLIRDVAEYITRTSIWPQPELAVANALTFIGAIAGRKFRTQYGGMSNIYTIGLLDSGGGKDHSRKEINKLAVLASCGEYIGGENFASGQALIKAMERNPAQLFQIDEIGKFIASATSGKASDHKADIITRLMVLYSAAGGVYQGTEYADQKTNPRTVIFNPCACLYGTATPSSFWGGLTSGESIDGFLSRLLIIEPQHYRQNKQRPDLRAPEPWLIEQIRAIAEYQPPGSGDLSAGDPLTVTMDDEIADDIDRLDASLTERMKSSAERSIYSRVVEQALKLAMIHAVSINHHRPHIGAESWVWGRELALWSANQVANFAKNIIADNDFEAACKQVMAAVKAGGADGVTEWEVSRSCSRFRGMNKAKRREVLEVLESDYGIRQVSASSGKAGRPSKRLAFPQ